VLYDADTFLHPAHHPVSIWDSEEVLVHQVVSMKKMNEKPGHVRPANSFYDKLNALKFVPQQELSREQAYWLPQNCIFWPFGIITKQRYSMATNEETNAAGTDTRPPMLVENDYESWKIRIHRYIRGKPNGKLIWKSIQDGPTPHPMVTDPPPANSTVMPAPRKKLDSEFNDE
ncbi:hypothetical protein Tco_1330910, partial [Tanacetum coccineum]